MLIQSSKRIPKAQYDRNANHFVGSVARAFVLRNVNSQIRNIVHNFNSLCMFVVLGWQLWPLVSFYFSFLSLSMLVIQTRASMFGFALQIA